MVNVKLTSGSCDIPAPREKAKGVALAALPLSATRFGYAEVPFTIVTPAVEVVRVAVAEVASCNPRLFKLTVRLPLSPGSMKLSPLQQVSLFATVDRSRNALPTTGAPSDCSAGNGITMPAPESRSVPGASISIAVLVKVVLSCACVREGFADFMRAAMAAACGAAAEVP